MRMTIISMLLCCSQLAAMAQAEYQHTINITRSGTTGFTKLIIVAPCPQSDQYQDITKLNYTDMGNWTLCEISENQNKYLELDMNKSELSAASKDFSVGYSFVASPKIVNIDFSPYKNQDGSWTEMPEYDTSSADYQDNTKQSGEIVVPTNSTITTISDQLFAECGNNKLAYAERCYEYVASNYPWLAPDYNDKPLSEVLSAGGGNSCNVSSIYISLLRAKGIPARHVFGRVADNFAEEYPIGSSSIKTSWVWSEFFIQDFGWVPVDVPSKSIDPTGDYFGKYNLNMVVMQRGVVMEYPTSDGLKTINTFNSYCWWWYWNSTSTVTMTTSEEFTGRLLDISDMDNAIYIEPTEGRLGTTIDLRANMKNTVTPVGCSFKLTLPDGLRLATDEDGDVVYTLGNRAKKMSLTMKDWGDGTYNFALSPSTATATISGNEGTVLTFQVHIPDDMAAGDYMLKATKCLVQSKVDGMTTDIELSDVTTTLTVEDYLMGDVNGDGHITPADAIMTLYYYFEVEQTGFNVKAADVNDDKAVTPADAIEILYLYFGQSSQTRAVQTYQTLIPQ